MGLIIKLGQDACGATLDTGYSLIGPVPKAIEGKPIMFRADRFTLISKATKQ